MIIKDCPFNVSYENTNYKFPVTHKQNVFVVHALTVGANGFESEQKAIDFMKDNTYKVSANDLILRNRQIIHFADFGLYTHHAGYSLFKEYNKDNGYKSINKVSYGVELIRLSNEDQYTAEQYLSLAWLQKYYCKLFFSRLSTHKEIRNEYIEQYNCVKDADGVFRNSDHKKIAIKSDPIHFDMDYYGIIYNSIASHGGIQL